MSERMYSPSPTVRSSPVPMYMQGVGFLSDLEGDDAFLGDLPPDFFRGATAAPTAVSFSPGGNFYANIVPPSFGLPSSIASMSPISSLYAPQNPAIQPLLDRGFSSGDAEMIRSVAASGHLSESQWNDIMSGRHTHADIVGAIFGAVRSVTNAVAATRSGSSGGGPANAGPVDTTPQQPELRPGPSPRVAVGPAGYETGRSPGFEAAMDTELIPGVKTKYLALGAGALLLLASMRRR